MLMPAEFAEWSRLRQSQSEPMRDAAQVIAAAERVALLARGRAAEALKMKTSLGFRARKREPETLNVFRVNLRVGVDGEPPYIIAHGAWE